MIELKYESVTKKLSKLMDFLFKSVCCDFLQKTWFENYRAEKCVPILRVIGSSGTENPRLRLNVNT